MLSKLTLEQIVIIQERFKELTSGENLLSERQACKLLGKKFGVSRQAINYWTSPKVREHALQYKNRRRNLPEVITQQQIYYDAYYMNGGVRRRKQFYAKLRRSHLASVILPTVFEKSNNEILNFQEITDLVRKETDIGFRQETLKLLLIDRYFSSARSLPLKESDRPGYYRINPDFYK